MLKEIKIHKYRGFKDVSFKIGSQLTIIADKNQGDRNFHTLTIHQYTQYIPSGIVI